MGNYSIGDLVSLKNHPYNIAENSKIGANSFLTPPIMVVTEILKSKKFNPDSEIKESVPNQLLCTFFNSKNSSFEKFWFKYDEVFSLHNVEEEYVEIENTEISYSNESISSLKKDYLYKLVVLLTADEELRKKKITWIKNKEDVNYKTEAYLEFLPPIMTVIDVVENSTFLKERRDPKDGSLKKDSSKFLLKCKWFNNIKQTFSEEFIPYSIIKKVTFSNEKLEAIKIGIANKTVFSINSTDREIKSRNEKIKKIVIFKDVIILNHSITLLYKDIFSNKISTESLEKIDIISLEKKIEELIENKYPDYTLTNYTKRDSLIWDKEKFYRIKYVDRNGRSTERYIINAEVQEFDTEEEEKVKFVIADCLLRNGDLRHFKLSNINERLEMNDLFKELKY